MKYFAILLLSCTMYAQQLIPPAVFDGPAELPRITMETGMSSTPSLNPPKTVAAGASLQAMLNTAICGDNILVDPAWVGGVIKLPTLICDAQHWITVQNAGLTVIDEFTRIHPGIPMPRIVLPVNAKVTGGAYVRMIGFEVTRVESTGGFTGAFIAPGPGAHDLILDRMYIHGTGTTESVRGIDLSNALNVAVINSYISDFHCLAPGKCGDSQAISGGVGTVQDGNYLIQNNYLESSGENILFGGSSATGVPTDITIRYNDLVKPASWNPADPSYISINGLPFTVKNLFELKTGKRVLFEGNRLVGTWGGFSQTGYGILLTPKNQGGQCPVCEVTDVTVRNNWVSRTGEALQLAYTNTFDGFFAADSGRWSIHNNLFDQLNYTDCYKCSSWLVQLTTVRSSAGAVLHDVSVNQNTFLVDGGRAPSGFLIVGGAVAQNVSFTNNITPSGIYGIYGTDWAAGNCTFGQAFKPGLIPACWGGVSGMTGNVIFVQPGVQTVNAIKSVPVGNYLFPTGVDQVSLQNSLSLRRP